MEIYKINLNKLQNSFIFSSHSDENKFMEIKITIKNLSSIREIIVLLTLWMETLLSKIEYRYIEYYN